MYWWYKYLELFSSHITACSNHKKQGSVLVDEQVRTGVWSNACVDTPQVTWLQPQIALLCVIAFRLPAVNRGFATINFPVISSIKEELWEKRKKGILLWWKRIAKPNFQMVMNSLRWCEASPVHAGAETYTSIHYSTRPSLSSPAVFWKSGIYSLISVSAVYLHGYKSWISY